MIRTTSALLIALLIVAPLTLFGCGKKTVYRTGGTTIHTKHPGPPPHAPAHGYRHKHPHGTVLVYDSGVGMYVVNGHTEVYFHKDRYYRLRGTEWHRSVHIEGPWHTVAVKTLPAGLQKKWLSKGQAKKGKKNNKAQKNK